MPTIPRARATHCHQCAIRESCVLGGMAGEERTLVDSRIGERTFHRDDVVLGEAEVSDVVRVVKVGTVFAYRRGLDGRSRPIGVVSRGSAIGLFGMFDMPSQATCIALTAVRVCELPMAALRSAGACSSPLVAHVARSVMKSFAAVTVWSEALRLPGVVNQLAYVVVLLADANMASTVELPSHSALAELLGTRRETVARALATLEREQGIRRHERRRCEVFRDRLLARLSSGVR